MRKLKTRDIPSLCRCLKKLGIKDRFQKIAQEADTAADAWGRGFDLIWEVFDSATEESGEAVIYEFRAGPFEMTPEEVADLDFDVLGSLLKQFAQENNLSAFFKSAAKSMK